MSDNERQTVSNEVKPSVYDTKNNLVSIGSLSTERQREIQSMGGKASIKKKILTDAFRKGLEKKPNAKMEDILTGIDPTLTITSTANAIRDAVLTSLVVRPEAKLLNVVLDRVEGKLTDQIEVKGDFLHGVMSGFFGNFKGLDECGNDQDDE